MATKQRPISLAQVMNDNFLENNYTTTTSVPSSSSTSDQDVSVMTRRMEKISFEPVGKVLMPGRIVFGSFRNPDTHVAIQEASMAAAEEAVKERRNQIMAGLARNNEYNTSQQIERDATARMQRLAANKRNTRRSKAK